jgi:hypothetical protein
MINKETVTALVEEWLQGNDYFLVDVIFGADDKIVIEIDHADGVWIEDCAELSRFLQERLGEELGDYEMEVLEQKFQILLSRLNERPLVKIRYFIPDLYKDGGSYKEEEVIVRRIDMNRRILISEDKKSYDLAYIVNVSSDLFDDYDF